MRIAAIAAPRRRCSPVGCAQGETACVRDAGAPYCANTQSDNLNCGACGNACGQKQLCVQGACVSQCGGGQTVCSPDGGAPYCASLATDNANCGACGNACSELQVCAGGKCGDVCLSFQTKCAPPDGGVGPDGGTLPSFCADLKNDNANCGACGYYCPFKTPFCSNGVCVPAG
jgi:hypothetical protein